MSEAAAIDSKTFPIALTSRQRLAWVQLIGTPDPATGQRPQLIIDARTGKLVRRMTKAVGLDPIMRAAAKDEGYERVNSDMLKAPARTFNVKGDIVAFVVASVAALRRDERLERELGPIFDVFADIVAGNEVTLPTAEETYDPDKDPDAEIARWVFVPPEAAK